VGGEESSWAQSPKGDACRLIMCACRGHCCLWRRGGVAAWRTDWGRPVQSGAGERHLIHAVGCKKPQQSLLDIGAPSFARCPSPCFFLFLRLRPCRCHCALLSPRARPLATSLKWSTLSAQTAIRLHRPRPITTSSRPPSLGTARHVVLWL
jgi:hypothetical protein